MECFLRVPDRGLEEGEERGGGEGGSRYALRLPGPRLLIMVRDQPLFLWMVVCQEGKKEEKRKRLQTNRE